MYYSHKWALLFIVYFCVFCQFTFRLLSCIIMLTKEQEVINMTIRELYEWVVENQAEDYSIKVEIRKDKAYLTEINDDKKEVIFYSE